MSSTYNQLLGATIQHLEDLKSRGVRHVAVSPETLAALSRPPAGKPQTMNSKSTASGTPGTAPARRGFPAQAETVLGAPIEAAFPI
jgi:hypothetical protein